ncbi:LysE family translocator [Enterobacterales bacterium AE_CKDN230030158-1A_HGKHYDSX7]
MSATYLSFAIAVALLIASPGPIVALVITDARRAWPAWTIVGGVVSAQLLLVSALIAIYLTLDINPAFIDWGQVLGGVYLAWLGIKTLGSSSERSDSPSREHAHCFWRALGVGLSNPKDILFFLAFLPGFILPAEPFTPQAVALMLIWAVIDISILIIYSLLSRCMVTIGKAQRMLDLLPGYFLLAIGSLSFALGLGRIVQG